jgi:hypothetical protein
MVSWNCHERRLWVKRGKPRSEHMFSGMLRTAAGSQRWQHLRSAPAAVVGLVYTFSAQRMLIFCFFVLYRVSCNARDIDRLRVVHTALRDAASIARLMVTNEATIA